MKKDFATFLKIERMQSQCNLLSTGISSDIFRSFPLLKLSTKFLLHKFGRYSLTSNYYGFSPYYKIYDISM